MSIADSGQELYNTCVTMQIKIDYNQYVASFLQRLSDVRFAGQVIFVVIVLLISWSGVKAIQTNYSLQKQIAALEQQNKLQQLQNANLKLQNQYYDSSQYLELSARQNFGLAQPGEKLVIVPKKVALASTLELPKKVASTASNGGQPQYQRNFQSWADFFLHRQTNDL